MRCILQKGALSLAISAMIVLMFTSAARAQSFEQSLPNGLLTTDGSSSSSFPFNSSSDQTWQFGYDTSQFVSNGPILINELYWRVNGAAAVVGNFSINDLEITLIEASNPTSATSTTLADNILRAEVVRTGGYFNSFQTAPTNGVGCWIPLRLNKSFLYDPSSGNDLIVEMRLCGVNTAAGASVDTHSSGFAAVRLGNVGSCVATASTFSAQSLAPVLKMDYTPVLEQTLPAGEMNANSNSSTGFISVSAGDQIWQWHYDVTEFNAAGPITISEISIRADSNTTNVSAFDYNDLEVTLIEASTGYEVATHDLTFANNIQRSKIVRSGRWAAPETEASGAGSSTWISLQLAETFDFDPSQGNDFIIQLRLCGGGTAWGISMDGVSAIGPGSVGGNRYGNTTDCNAVASTFSNNEFVPVVKISYTEREISSFPFVENFDNWGPRFDGTSEVPPGWVRDLAGNEDGWVMYSREHSVGTTPVDHTTGKRNVGYYASTEDSSSNSPQESLESPIFNLALLGNPVATFWVYSQSTLDSNGLDENFMNVDIRRYNPSGTVSTFSNRLVGGPIRVIRSGCWTKYSVDLNFFTNDRVSLVFRASTDSDEGFYHDFAIDDLRVGNRLAVEGGQAPTVQSTLDVNDAYNNNGDHVASQRPGPYYTCAKPGGKLNIHLEGPFGLQPTALWIGPLNIGVAGFGMFGQMDTGTPDTSGDGIPESLFVFGDATNPTPTLLDLFFFTDVAGNLDLTFTINPAFPLGTFGAFQGVVGNGASGIFLSNAVELSIVP